MEPELWELWVVEGKERRGHAVSVIEGKQRPIWARLQRAVVRRFRQGQ